MRAITFFLAATLLNAAATPVAAQQQGTFSWRLDDEAAPANPAQASRDGFGVFMMVTDDYEGFWRAWEGPTPPHVSTTDIVRRGSPVHAMIVFSGCHAGPDGNCNVTAEFSMVGPGGGTYGETIQVAIWRYPPAPGYNLQLGEGSLGFVLEPEDPLGEYTLGAAVTDHIAALTLQVSQVVTATEPGSR